MKTRYKNINIKNLLDVTTPESAYFLGFFWADGNIYKKPGARGSKCVSIQLAKSDALSIKNLFLKVCPYFSLGVRKGKGNVQDRIRFRKWSGKLFDFLEAKDYHIKSGAAPDKILSHIPERLHNYWFRGYFDGDGCVMLRGAKKTQVNVVFVSCSKQDWSFVSNMLRKNKIYNFYIYEMKHKVGESSRVSINGIDNSRRIFNFLYRGKEFGLKRKKTKFIEGFINKAKLEAKLEASKKNKKNKETSIF